MKNIKCIYVPKADIDKERVNLEKRFSLAVRVPGTQGYHRVVPVNETDVRVYQTSDAEDSKIYTVSKDPEEEEEDGNNSIHSWRLRVLCL